MPPLPRPEKRPLPKRSRRLAKHLPPGHLPSDGRGSPLHREQETFISSPLFPSPLFSSPPSLLSFSPLNPGILWVEH